MDYEPSETVIALEKVFDGVVRKYTEQLKDAREGEVIDATFGADSEVASALSFLRSAEAKLTSLIVKYPEAEMGLGEWFMAILWRSSEAVKGDIKKRQLLIADFMALRASRPNSYDLESSYMLDVETKFLQKNLALLDKTEATGHPADYQAFFHQCLTTHHTGIFNEVAEVVLQIGSKNLIQVQLDATEEFTAHWQNLTPRKSWWR